MAICALVLQVEKHALEGVLNTLRGMPEIIDAGGASPERIGASLEIPSAQLLDFLRTCHNLPGVIDTELVYVNYEDDMDENGRIDCGPLQELQARLKRKA